MTVRALAKLAKENNVDIRPVEIDVVKEPSVQKGISRIVDEAGRLDALTTRKTHLRAVSK